MINSQINSFTTISTGTMHEDDSREPSKKTILEEDSLNSGESIFKNYTFTPNASRNPEEVQQCIDFWKFIEQRQDLFPHRGFKVEKKAKQQRDSVKTEEEISWGEVLDLLKSKKMDVLARSTMPKRFCEVPRCHEEIDDDTSKIKSIDDDFNLDALNEFDPQKYISAEVECQTDPILTEEKETQTDLPDSLMELRAQMNALDDVLKEVADTDLTGYFDCICDDPCAWLPYPTVTARASKESIESAKRRRTNQCTCSCGENNCLCSLCGEILKAIENARDSFEQLSAFGIEQCPCAKTSCACLEDYRTLLDVKLEVNQAVRDIAQDPQAKLHPPIMCKCSCGQDNCPCRIVMQLFEELDQLMGYKDKKMVYHDDKIDLDFGVDVCRCDGEMTDEYDMGICACLSFYQKRIESKMAQDSIEVDVCPGNCSEECNLETCAKCVKQLSTPTDTIDSETCVCQDHDCLIAVTTYTSSSILLSDSSIQIPPAPPNSISYADSN